jgi:hypothetical protein
MGAVGGGLRAQAAAIFDSVPGDLPGAGWRRILPPGREVWIVLDLDLCRAD